MPTGLADGFDPVTDGLRPRFTTGKPSARVRLPDLSLGAVQLEDAASGAAVDIALRDALIVEAEAAEGYVVYPRGHASGATLLHRALPDGVEDYLSFDTPPAKPTVSYGLSLRQGVTGLRLVAGALEMLDAGGTPRLRVAPPYIVGADGERTDAVLAIEGCRFDTSGAPPWGRKVTAPGANSCTVRVSWNDDDVEYPAVLDPRWTTTANSMVASRTDHTMTLLTDGRVLVTGGRTSNTSTTGVNTAEVFNPAGGGTWAGTNAMTGVRYMHTATLLPSSSNTSTSGRVLIAGGVTGTASINTTQLWNPANGQWANGPNLNAARHGHTATLMVSTGANSGNVLVTGGMSLASGTTTVLNTVAIYTNPTTGTSTGSWAATGNMAAARRFHTATMLTTNSQNNTNFVNRVLVVGGNTGNTNSTTSAQLFNPLTSTWSDTTALGTARDSHTATRLANGNLLITGGRTNNGSPINTTAVFTIPATGTSATWPASGNMQAARIAHTATLMGTTLASTGSVVVAGGSTNGTAAINTAELWNGSTFSLVATNLPSAVQSHTATLLAGGTALNGTVLVAGGNSGTNAVNTARIFDPSLGVTCTTNGQCLSGFCANGVCCATACTNQCQSCNLTGSVGTCTTRPANSTCNDNNVCTSNDVCTGTTCGGAPVTCPGADQCHTVAACGPTSGCPQPQQLADGTVCNDGNANTDVDACAAGTCVGTASAANVTSFDLLGRWSVGAGGAGTIVGLNANHTQGTKSLEVTAQNFVPFNSVRMGSLGSVGPLVLLDILLPTQQPNPDWFGSVQMFVNAPSVGINNAFLGQVELSGLPLATWQTLAFQLTPQQVTQLSGSYNDLTFTIALNVPFNATGHYLFDNLRFNADIFLALQGIAKDSANVTKAIFTYTTAATSPITIPYGPANALSNQNGFILAPLEFPPVTFVSSPHPAFVATLAGPQLTWKVGSHSVTATQSSTQLPTETGPGGGRDAVLPDGTRVPLDTVPPAVANAIVPSDTSFTPATRHATSTTPIRSGPRPPGRCRAGSRWPTTVPAEYTVPLDVPAGRNGVEPHLSLVYNSRSTNSRAGEGFLGPGWALRGLHKIARCNTTFGYAEERGASPAAVAFDATDAFCFDDERLVQFLPNEYRTKRDMGSKFVVTATDSNGPVSWQVFRHDGLIETYGTSSGAVGNYTRITSVTGSVPGETTLTTTEVRTEWLLSQVKDRFANTMTITYQSGTFVSGFPGLATRIDPVRTMILPDTISYTSNTLTGRSATKTVKFGYESTLSGPRRPVVKLKSGVKIATSLSLLTSIAVSAPDPVKPAVVTTYKLYYERPSITQRPLLTRVQRCGRDNICMQPTQFTWEAGSYNFRRVISDVDDSHRPDIAYDAIQYVRSMKSRFLLNADVNGDGREDLVYRTFLPLDPTIPGLRNTRIKVRYGGPNGFGPAIDTGIPTILEHEAAEQFSGNFFFKPVPLDINGDGRMDLSLGQLFPDVPSGPRLFDLFLNDGTGVFTRQPVGLTQDHAWDPAFNPEAAGVSIATFFMPGDYNGDGQIDVARSLDNLRFGIRRNVNGALFPSYFSPTLPILNIPVPWDNTNSFGVLTADVDGDGRTEVVMGGPLPFAVHDDPNSNADAVQTNLTGITPAGANFFAGRRLDLNGDGLPDIIVRQTVNDVARIWFNLGKTSASTNHFIPVIDLDASNTPDRNFDLVDGLIADLNDDGLEDMFVPAGCNTLASKIYISRGDGTFTKVPMDSQIPLGFVFEPNGHNTEPQVCHRVLMDIDGDGQLDFVQPEMGTPENPIFQAGHLRIYFRDGKKPDRIKGILNGIGANTTIEYGRAGLDGPGPGSCQWPKACSGRQVDVVSGYTVSEGRVPAGQTNTTHYSMNYAGSTADALGAGWLGFARVDRTNDRTQVKDVKFYDLTTRIGNWYPYVGMPTLVLTDYPLSATSRRITHRRETTLTAIRSNSADQFGPYLVRALKIDDREIEQDPGEPFDEDDVQRGTIQNFTYDVFGNVKTHEILRTNTGSRDFIDYTVTNDNAQWLIDKVERVTTTSRGSNGETDQRVTSFTIDPTTGAIMGKTIQPDDPVLQLAGTFTRNADGMVSFVTETPASGPARTRRIDYDSIEGAWPVAQTNVLGQTTRYDYHCGLGVVASSTDPNGVTSRTQFDGFGRPRHRFEALGLITHLNFQRPADNLGVAALWSDTTTRSGVTTSDELGREVTRTETAFDGEHQRRVIRVYDPKTGKPQFVSRPFNATSVNTTSNIGWTFTYDELGRTTSATPPGEAIRTMVYEGLKMTQQVSLGDKAIRVENGEGRVIRTAAIEPSSPAPNHEITTTFEYGPFGALRHVHQPGGGTVTMAYDHLGHRTQIIDPDAGTRTTIFNAFGEVEREQAAGQADVVYGRDRLGRPETITSGDGVARYSWDTAANGIGKVDNESSPFGVTARYTYSPNGQAATTTWNVANTDFAFDWGYDTPGRLQTITYPGTGTGARFAVAVGYGGDGYIGSVSPASGGAPYWQKTDVADDGQMHAESFGDGLFGLTDTDPVTGRVTHIATGTGNLVPDPFGGQTFQNAAQSLGYGYYIDGKLQVRRDSILEAVETFSYDNVDRVTTWGVSTLQSFVVYGYDDTGNLKSRREDRPGSVTLENYGYGANGAGPHALTSSPFGSYGYDPSGRQTSRPGQPLLAYTSFDLPKQIQSATAGTTTFSYSIDGRRVRKVNSARDVISLESLYERRIQNGVTSHVFYLPGGGKIVGQVLCEGASPCEAPRFFHKDMLGTIDTVTSNGVVTGRQKRDPFGRLYAPGNFTDPNPTVALGFIGQPEDREEGLVDLNRRLYDANLGRFISPDPLVKNFLDGQAYNRFAYGRNNPLFFIDPSGLEGDAVGSSDGASESDPGGLAGVDAIAGDSGSSDSGLAAATPPSGPGGGEGAAVAQQVDPEDPSPIGGAGPGYVAVTQQEGTYHAEDRWGNWTPMPSIQDRAAAAPTHSDLPSAPVAEGGAAPNPVSSGVLALNITPRSGSPHVGPLGGRGTADGDSPSRRAAGDGFKLAQSVIKGPPGSDTGPEGETTVEIEFNYETGQFGASVTRGGVLGSKPVGVGKKEGKYGGVYGDKFHELDKLGKALDKIKGGSTSTGVGIPMKSEPDLPMRYEPVPGLAPPPSIAVPSVELTFPEERGGFASASSFGLDVNIQLQLQAPTF